MSKWQRGRRRPRMYVVVSPSDSLRAFTDSARQQMHPLLRDLLDLRANPRVDVGLFDRKSASSAWITEAICARQPKEKPARLDQDDDDELLDEAEAVYDVRCLSSLEVPPLSSLTLSITLAARSGQFPYLPGRADRRTARRSREATGGFGPNREASERGRESRCGDDVVSRCL